jgi:AbrB family looped-hinge helix DNA binding protein
LLYDSKVTRQGQTTIPKDIRDKYGIVEGDEVTYIDLGDHIVLMPKPRNPIEALKKLQVPDDASIHEIKQIALDAAKRDVEKRHSEPV